MAADFHDHSDVQLVVAIGRAQQGALAEAFRRHGGSVHGRARRILNDATGADDVVQQVMLKLWTDPEQFDRKRGTLRGFLLKQAHSRALDVVRSSATRRRREGAHEDLVVYDLETEVCEDICACVRTEQVRAGLAGLSAGERDAIELAYFGGHTYRGVAQVLGQPEGTIKSRIRTGLGKLSRVLADAADSDVPAPRHPIVQATP
jgi:RNA polymerase sigma-70 factor, ECF subfamily